MKTRILAVASAGGHLTQLQLAMGKAASQMDVVLATTKLSFVREGVEVYPVPDFSRADPWRAFSCFLTIRKLAKSLKPDVIFSTGAAPGLVALAAGKLTGVRTVWLDSCANHERLSLSGRVATLFADVVLTQWRHLETSKVLYRGSVL